MKKRWGGGERGSKKKSEAKAVRMIRSNQFFIILPVGTNPEEQTDAIESNEKKHVFPLSRPVYENA